jgi:outer membrane receptor for ferric coprogen and ferric-rhodotorulic acid
MRTGGLFRFLLWMVVTAVASASACADEVVKFNLHIDSQPLDTALQEFARQSGIQIVFFSKLTEGRRAPALDGEYTVGAAMSAILAGSRLTYRAINSKTLQIGPLPAAAAGTKRSAPVPAGPDSRGGDIQDQGPLEEVVISTAEGLVATRIATPLREIPQTISIISSEQMRQQNDTDLSDALARAPGITAVRTDSLEQDFYSRGFKITSYHIDGGAPLFSVTGIDEPVLRSVPGVPFLGTPDLSEFDHLELLRGSDALFGGNGNPGATVSMVRKRPLAKDQFLADAWTGSWHNNRVEVDATGPLALDGALRGRIDGLFTDRDYFYDTATMRRKRLFAVVDADLTSSTVLALGGSYQWDDALPFVNGLPRNQDSSDPHLPRRTALTFDWSNYHTRTSEIYLQLRQDLGSDWKLRFNATSWDASVTYAYGFYESGIDPVTGSIPGTPDANIVRRPNTQRQYALDLTLTGTRDWFGHREEIAVGADFARATTRWAVDDYTSNPSVLTDVYNYNPAAFPDPRLTASPLLGLDVLASERRTGLFASMRAFLTSDLSVVGGARLSDNHNDTDASIYVGNQSVSPQASFGNSRVVTPYAGVMYDLNQHLALYASYADIYRSTGVDNLGAQLRPEHGVDYEAGLKGAWRDGRLNGSMVIYRIEQYNVAIADPAIVPSGITLGANTSDGIDLEINGQLQPGWLIGSGYTYNTNQAAIGGALSNWTPRHLLKAWSSRQLPGRLHRLTVSANLQAQSANATTGSYCPVAGAGGICTAENQDFELRQGSYAVVDLRAGYEIDSHWRAAFSLNNVFDRVYYQSLGTPQTNNWYGEPRNFLVRIDARF